MKVYFCLNQAGLSKLGERYFKHLAVSVHSCVQMTDLEPCLIYDGEIGEDIRRIEALGCEIIQHQLSFKDDLRRVCEENSVNFDVAGGAFLRLDIPLINLSDTYALYADVDVMFLRQPDFSDCRPKIFAAAPEHQIENYSHINSGVLLINIPGLRAELPGFVDRIIGGSLKTPSGDPYDQGHINDYFRHRIDRLSPIYNWKPYWGEDDAAIIVHWHGVKYPAAKAISQGREKEITTYHPHPEIYQRNPPGYLAYIKKFESFLERMPIPVNGASGDIKKERDKPITNIVGPSHVVRWSWHIRDKVVEADLPFDRLFGIGAAPIWSKRLFETAEQTLEAGGRVGVMVGDFRFGNGIAMKADADAGPLFQDEYLGIEAQAITLEMDRKALDRGLAALKAWQGAFGKKARFIFWDLFGRQVHDRLSGRYIGGGRYFHPMFNYTDVVEQFPDADIVDLSPLLRSPMHEVQRLFIDSSNHPSQIGYLLLNGVLCEGRDAIEAYQCAVAEVEAELFALARGASRASDRKILLTGRSVWLDTLMSYMGKDSAMQLAKEGLVLAPLARKPWQTSIEQILQMESLDLCSPVVVSAGGKDLSFLLARALGTDPSFWNDVPHIDWETASSQAINERGETPRYVYGVGDERQAAEVVSLKLTAHMVEQGPLGMPSWSGIRHVLDLINRALVQRS